VQADAAWDPAETASISHRAIRWYAANLSGSDRGPPTASMSPDHRRSNDTSVDEAIAACLLKDGFSSLASMSTATKYMLQWYTKNVEKNLGANLADSSMKYWDVDDRYAYEGVDVLLKEGYSRLVQHMFESLTARGECFQCLLSSSASRIEYNRQSTKRKQRDQSRKARTLDISDTCCLTTTTGLLINSDFVVCAVPLGVLKASIEGRPGGQPPIVFTPSLPEMKQDAIAAVGFGLLNKIFLRFDRAFWRTIKTSSENRPVQFGNATTMYPHHFMFVDVGAAWNCGPNYPYVLMTLVSGKEAAYCELLRDEDIVQDIVSTLKELFGAEQVPNPLSYAVTRWGSDEFSRGSHTFLPPGATDDDLYALHTPVNGNGDSALLEGPEVMRLFFAGEHTSALHPSTTHGALRTLACRFRACKPRLPFVCST
jgi:[histone H3]-N6,N6-dimethyl-L-lysine4 FAD-dependent demethylase